MWRDSAVFGNPHTTEYTAATDTSFDVVGNTEGRTSYYEHETGTDQNRNGTITAILLTYLLEILTLVKEQQEEHRQALQH